MNSWQVTLPNKTWTRSILSWRREGLVNQLGQKCQPLRHTVLLGRASSSWRWLVAWFQAPVWDMLLDNFLLSFFNCGASLARNKKPADIQRSSGKDSSFNGFSIDRQCLQWQAKLLLYLAILNDGWKQIGGLSLGLLSRPQLRITYYIFYDILEQRKRQRDGNVHHPNLTLMCCMHLSLPHHILSTCTINPCQLKKAWPPFFLFLSFLSFPPSSCYSPGRDLRLPYVF